MLRGEGHLVEIDHPVDPHLEIAEIQRRLFRAGWPAVLFTRPTGSAFPILTNLYGTQARIERIFADTFDRVRRLVELKIDPTVIRADYGQLPDLGQIDWTNDVLFTWNGTTSGVRVPNADFIPETREGLSFADATSGVFAYDIDWSKIDVATFS